MVYILAHKGIQSIIAKMRRSVSMKEIRSITWHCELRGHGLSLQGYTAV